MSIKYTKVIRDKIVSECRQRLTTFQNMSANEIYDWICGNCHNVNKGNINDDMAMRMASFMLYDLSHNQESLL